MVLALKGTRAKYNFTKKSVSLVVFMFSNIQ